MQDHIIWEFSDDAYLRCIIRNTQKHNQQNLHCLRVYFVLSGTLSIRIGLRNHKYGPDEITMINAHEPFCVTQGGAVVAIFDIELSFVEAEIPNLWFSRNPTVESDPDPLYVLKSLFARFVKFNVDIKESKTFLNRSMYYAIVHHLLTFFRVDKPRQQSSEKTRAASMEGIATYVEQNYQQPLSLNELAARFYLSPPHLSKLFKQFYGITFSDYLTQIRLQNCLQELTAKGKSIEFLAEQYGFPNSRSFIAHFKRRYGVTPGQYRKQHLEQLTNSKAEGIGDSNASHAQELELFAKYLTAEVDPGQNAEEGLIRLDEIPPCDITQSGVPLAHHFRNMISVSSASDILSVRCQDMLKTIQREVGFRFIRFHGILDDAMMVYNEDEYGRPEYNFTFIDLILDFLLSIGLRPFVELSYMPRKLARSDAHRNRFLGSYISLPKEIERWNDLVASFVRHVNSRYGREEVASWPFSLWDLPDSGETRFGLGSVEAYFSFYQNTYFSVMRQNKAVKFCGPSCLTETAENGSFLPEFLRLCQENGCLPDMLQYRFYAVYTAPSGKETRHLMYRYSQNALKESIAKVKHNMRDWPGGIGMLHITEWNATISQRELLSDTAFQAAYIVKNVLENYDSIASLCYWSLADYVSDGFAPKNLFHGGQGLFTCNGIKKAAYHAFRLLSRLGDTKLSAGDGYFITRGHGGWQILLYNYQHYSELYANGELFDMTFTNRYTPFPNANRKKFSVLLDGFTDHVYLQTETTLNPQYGSSYDKWIELGAIPLSNQGDFEYLQSVSVPLLQKKMIEIKEGKLELSFTLEPHEIRLIELSEYMGL